MKQTSKQHYNVFQNVGWMIGNARRSCKSVLWMCVLAAALTVGVNLVQLFIAPQILSRVEQQAPLPELLGTIGVFSLALSLLYLLTLAVSIAMVARAFGAYAVQFLHEGSQEEHLILLYALGIIAVMTLFNSLSNHAVGRLEVILVGIKMMILLLLIIAGVWSLQPAHISVSAPPSSGAFFSCIGITFLAYAGFGMMANAADKVKDPQVIMPRAFLVAIGVTTLLYISLALVLLSDAQAASPLLGHVGYVIVVIGALLATASAINANLFAVFNIMDNMGSERELPKLMNKSLWRQSTWGNIIVVVLIMLMTAALNLGSLASVASATFVICYLAVFVVAIRLRHDIHASLPILIVGTLVMLLVIVGFIYSLWSQGSRALIWIIGSLLLSLIVAMVMKRNKTV